MLRTQILAKLKQKFPGLPNEFLGFVADKLAAKTTEESQIEGAIDELNNGAISLTEQAQFFQSEADRRVTEAKKKFETEKKPEPKPAGKDPEPEDETKKQLRELSEKLEQMQKQQTSQSLTEKLHLKLQEKKIPATFAKGRMPENEEGLEALVTEIETDFNEIKQGFVNQGLKDMSGTPVGGAVTKETVSKDIADWAAANGKKPEVVK